MKKQINQVLVGNTTFKVQQNNRFSVTFFMAAILDNVDE